MKKLIALASLSIIILWIVSCNKEEQKIIQTDQSTDIPENLTGFDELEGIDHDLFDLLGEYAVSAVCSSYLFTKAQMYEDPENWKKTITEMSKEASNLEGRDIEPTVIW